MAVACGSVVAMTSRHETEIPSGYEVVRETVRRLADGHDERTWFARKVHLCHEAPWCGPSRPTREQAVQDAVEHAEGEGLDDLDKTAAIVDWHACHGHTVLVAGETLGPAIKALGRLGWREREGFMVKRKPTGAVRMLTVAGSAVSARGRSCGVLWLLDPPSTELALEAQRALRLEPRLVFVSNMVDHRCQPGESGHSDKTDPPTPALPPGCHVVHAHPVMSPPEGAPRHWIVIGRDDRFLVSSPAQSHAVAAAWREFGRFMSREEWEYLQACQDNLRIVGQQRDDSTRERDQWRELAEERLVTIRAHAQGMADLSEEIDRLRKAGDDEHARRVQAERERDAAIDGRLAATDHDDPALAAATCRRVRALTGATSGESTVAAVKRLVDEAKALRDRLHAQNIPGAMNLLRASTDDHLVRRVDTVCEAAVELRAALERLGAPAKQTLPSLVHWVQGLIVSKSTAQRRAETAERSAAQTRERMASLGDQYNAERERRQALERELGDAMRKRETAWDMEAKHHADLEAVRAALKAAGHSAELCGYSPAQVVETLAGRVKHAEQERDQARADLRRMAQWVPPMKVTRGQPERWEFPDGSVCVEHQEGGPPESTVVTYRWEVTPPYPAQTLASEHAHARREAVERRVASVRRSANGRPWPGQGWASLGVQERVEGEDPDQD